MREDAIYMEHQFVLLQHRVVHVFQQQRYNRKKAEDQYLVSFHMQEVVCGFTRLGAKLQRPNHEKYLLPVVRPNASPLLPADQASSRA